MLNKSTPINGLLTFLMLVIAVRNCSNMFSITCFISDTPLHIFHEVINVLRCDSNFSWSYGYRTHESLRGITWDVQKLLICHLVQALRCIPCSLLKEKILVFLVNSSMVNYYNHVFIYNSQHKTHDWKFLHGRGIKTFLWVDVQFYSAVLFHEGVRITSISLPFI